MMVGVEDRNDRQSMTAGKLLRRLLPLAVLGAGLALGALKLQDLWPQKLHVNFLPAEWVYTRGERLGVLVTPGQGSERPLFAVWFNLSGQPRRRLEHTFRLRRGEYRFRAVLEMTGGVRRQWQRNRLVSGDGEWTWRFGKDSP